MNFCKRWIALSLYATLLSACSAAKSTDNAENWHIRYTISGGIAGIKQELNIQQDGHYRVYDKKRGIGKDLIAGPVQLSRLHEQIERIASTANSQQAPLITQRRCADCLTQSVAIDYKDSRISYKSTNGLPKNLKFNVLLNVLSALLKQGLAGHSG